MVRSSPFFGVSGVTVIDWTVALFLSSSEPMVIVHHYTQNNNMQLSIHFKMSVKQNLLQSVHNFAFTTKPVATNSKQETKSFMIWLATYPQSSARVDLSWRCLKNRLIYPVKLIAVLELWKWRDH